MSLQTRLTGKKELVCTKAVGVNIALEILKEFEGRTFTIKEGLYLYHAVPTVDLHNFIQTKLPGYYNYETNLKTYTDRTGKRQVKIKIEGHIGFYNQLKRYNPLDMKISIKSKP